MSLWPVCFEQFQSGLKRHPFEITGKLGVDRRTGKLVAYAADLTGEGGGLANYSASVGLVAAAASIGIYNIPKVDVTSVVFASPAVPAGSMRGYGTLQSMTPLELMIDRAAEALGSDPIAFRKANALSTGQKNLTGNIPDGAVRTQEVLDKLAGHRIWIGRSAEKTRRNAQYPDKAYGVGVACVNKDYGGGADAALAKVEITPEGQILVTSSAVEIGTGLSTAIAVRAADHLGVRADRVTMGALAEWTPLRLQTSGNPYTITQAEQDAAASDPRWVPRLNVSTYASIGIYNIPKVDVTSVVFASPGVPAGSMRGYGTLQSMTPLELMIDRAAEALGSDPIALRKANALASGQKNLTATSRMAPCARRRCSTSSPDTGSGSDGPRRRPAAMPNTRTRPTGSASPASTRTMAAGPMRRWQR